jgi:hypothetical protein
MLSAAAAAALLGGCTQSVTGVPAAAPSAVDSPSASAEATTAATAAAPSSSACRVSVTGGSIRMTGGGRVRSVNNAHQFACKGGPLVALESIDAGGVRFRIDTTSVLVAVATTEQVGPYKITVRELDGQAADFDVDPGG